jgi:hypothetical protein
MEPARSEFCKADRRAVVLNCGNGLGLRGFHVDGGHDYLSFDLTAESCC